MSTLAPDFDVAIAKFRVIKFPQPPLTVQGKKATTNEYFTSLALDYYEIPYKFQVSYWGGRQVAGGRVLDFLALPYSREVGIQVFGDYWHEGQMSNEDRYVLALLEDFLRASIVVLWESETNSFESARRAIREHVL